MVVLNVHAINNSYKYYTYIHSSAFSLQVSIFKLIPRDTYFSTGRAMGMVSSFLPLTCRQFSIEIIAQAVTDEYESVLGPYADPP